jgi:hypothetical protein
MKGSRDTEEMPRGLEFPDEPVERREPAPPSAGLSTLVVEAVAGATGLDPTETTIPLDSYLNPDALDSLFADSPADGEAWVSFRIWGMRVVAYSDGRVVVHPPSASE